MFLFIISWKLKRRFRNCQYTGQTSLNLSIKAKRKLTTKFLQSLNFSTEMKIRVLVKYNLSTNPQTLYIFIEFHNDLLYIHECFWQCHLKLQGVSAKKGWRKFEGHFMPLNGRKSKKVTPKTPPKIQFYLLGGVFSPVYDMYTLL